MEEPVIDIGAIVRGAYQAAEENQPVTACPFPDNWDAAYRWQKAYHAKAKEIVEGITT